MMKHPSEAATKQVHKKLFLSISQNSQEKRHAGVSILIKLQLQGRCFPVNFALFLRTPFL